MHDRTSSVGVQHQIVDFIVMDASVVSVDHRIKLGTVVAVLGHDVQQVV